MKKILCLLMAFLLILPAAFAEETQTEETEIETDATATEEPTEEKWTHLGFDAGFALDLPLGWKVYLPDEEMKENDIRYCLSDADGDCWLYIQRWSSNCADIDSLKREIAQKAQPRTSGIYSYNGVDFVVYDLDEGDVSCCATLLNGEVLNFAFTPQSDREYMLLAIKIIGSFAFVDVDAE